MAALILAEAGHLVGPVAVLDDAEGALTGAATSLADDVRAWCDDLRDARDLPAANRARSLEAALTGARTVLWRLPRAVSAVQDYAERIASAAAPEVRVVAGARVKYLSLTMNEALGQSFGAVRASLGVQKSRVLHAEAPRAGVRARWPRTRRDPVLGLDVVARGLTFGTNRLDPGTALLWSQFDRLPGPGRAIDLGCGSGIMAAALARRGWQVTGVDVSAAACESCRLTAEANGVSVDVVQTVGLEGFPSAAADLIVCNPPFHRGGAKDTTPALQMFQDARDVLAPGGEFWTVFNSHLPYLGWLGRYLGPTRIAARNHAYTVARTRRPTRMATG